MNISVLYPSPPYKGTQDSAEGWHYRNVLPCLALATAFKDAWLLAFKQLILVTISQ